MKTRKRQIREFTHQNMRLRGAGYFGVAPGTFIAKMLKQAVERLLDLK